MAPCFASINSIQHGPILKSKLGLDYDNGPHSSFLGSEVRRLGAEDLNLDFGTEFNSRIDIYA